MVAWVQTIILWEALLLAILIVVATIDTITTVIKITEQQYDQNN